jgi:hypothetical protein
MLYTLCADFTLESLISWLETQDATEHYLYLNPSGCLLAEFFKSRGFTDVAGAALQRVKELRHYLHRGSDQPKYRSAISS